MRTIVEPLGEGVALYESEQRVLMNNPAIHRLMMADRTLSGPGITLRDEMRARIREGLTAVPEDQSVDDLLDWITDCVREGRAGIEMPMPNGRDLKAFGSVARASRPLFR